MPGSYLWDADPQRKSNQRRAQINGNEVLHERHGQQQPRQAGAQRTRALSAPDGKQRRQRQRRAWRAWIPWALCAFFLFVAGVFALEALSPIDDDLITKLALERGLNVGKGTDGSAGKLVLPGSPGTSSSTVDISLESKGYVVAFKLIQVSPKITGTVMKLNIMEGKFVEKGFVLAVLEDVEFKSDLDHAIAARKSAEGAHR